MEYFHISYIGRVTFLYPIVRRANANDKGKLGSWGPEMRDAAIALTTKIRVVEIAIERFNRDVSELNAEIADKTQNIDKCIGYRPPKGLNLQNHSIGFRLVASLDALLYEARSAYEMLCTFVIRFSKQILKKRCRRKDAEQILREAMLKQGHDSGWVVDLRKYRTTFFHETAHLVVCSPMPVRS